LKSGYYHLGLHPVTQRFVGIKWEGVYYVYTRVGMQFTVQCNMHFMQATATCMQCIMHSPPKLAALQ
jgi:hypothetical protein